MQEIAPGLWRWTAPHPEWRRARKRDSPSDWPRDVGCVLAELPDAVALIDPLLTETEHWDRLRERVGRRATHVLTTITWHRRSRDEVLRRFGGDREPPAGVEPIRLKPIRETVYWLPEQRALVPGDALIGDGAGGIRMCPESWLGYLKGVGHPELRAALTPLLGLGVEHVVVSHGEPVVGGGGAALDAALR